MGSLSYDPQSWEKKKVSDDITEYLVINSHLQLFKMAQFIKAQNKDAIFIVYLTAPLGTLLQYVKDENLPEFLILWEMYQNSLQDISKVEWYVKKIFLQANSLESAKLCVPEYYWKYFHFINFTGDGTIDIRDEYIYGLIEQAAMNNMILGLRRRGRL